MKITNHSESQIHLCAVDKSGDVQQAVIAAGTREGEEPIKPTTSEIDDAVFNAVKERPEVKSYFADGILSTNARQPIKA